MVSIDKHLVLELKGLLYYFDRMGKREKGIQMKVRQLIACSLLVGLIMQNAGHAKAVVKAEVAHRETLRAELKKEGVSEKRVEEILRQMEGDFNPARLERLGIKSTTTPAEREIFARIQKRAATEAKVEHGRNEVAEKALAARAENRAAGEQVTFGVKEAVRGEGVREIELGKQTKKAVNEGVVANDAPVTPVAKAANEAAPTVKSTLEIKVEKTLGNKVLAALNELPVELRKPALGLAADFSNRVEAGKLSEALVTDVVTIGANQKNAFGKHLLDFEGACGEFRNKLETVALENFRDIIDALNKGSTPEKAIRDAAEVAELKGLAGREGLENGEDVLRQLACKNGGCRSLNGKAMPQLCNIAPI